MTNPYFIDEDGVLQHYGVKGMKWGIRRDRRERQQKVTRRQNAAMNREAAYKFNTEKGQKIVQKAMSEPYSLIITKPPGGYPQLVSGEQFISYLVKTGGYFDVRATDLYGPDRIGNYKRQNFRKQADRKVEDDFIKKHS